mmetsp:Transcript_81827/g.226731  ORF Transcript_81827/g.226731 Transcript_81827/m.226731 type:complete len:234 (+) Transcript_81827:351-1052(+)
MHWFPLIHMPVLSRDSVDAGVLDSRPLAELVRDVTRRPSWMRALTRLGSYAGGGTVPTLRGCCPSLTPVRRRALRAAPATPTLPYPRRQVRRALPTRRPARKARGSPPAASRSRLKPAIVVSGAHGVPISDPPSPGSCTSSIGFRVDLAVMPVRAHAEVPVLGQGCTAANLLVSGCDSVTRFTHTGFEAQGAALGRLGLAGPPRRRTRAAEASRAPQPARRQTPPPVEVEPLD